MGVAPSIYAVFRLSGLLTALSLAAVVLLKGGWEAAAAGLMVAVGVACLVGFIALLASGERTHAQG